LTRRHQHVFSLPEKIERSRPAKGTTIWLYRRNHWFRQFTTNRIATHDRYPGSRHSVTQGWRYKCMGASAHGRASGHRGVGASGHGSIGASGRRGVGASGRRSIGASGHGSIGASGRRGMGASGHGSIGASEKTTNYISQAPALPGTHAPTLPGTHAPRHPRTHAPTHPRSLFLRLTIDIQLAFHPLYPAF
jgi:nuclear pore complex protein Nup214